MSGSLQLNKSSPYHKGSQQHPVRKIITNLSHVTVALIAVARFTAYQIPGIYTKVKIKKMGICRVKLGITTSSCAQNFEVFYH